MLVAPLAVCCLATDGLGPGSITQLLSNVSGRSCCGPSASLSPLTVTIFVHSMADAVQMEAAVLARGSLLGLVEGMTVGLLQPIQVRMPLSLPWRPQLNRHNTAVY